MNDRIPTFLERRTTERVKVGRKRTGLWYIIGAVICLVCGVLMLAVLTGEI